MLYCAPMRCYTKSNSCVQSRETTSFLHICCSSSLTERISSLSPDMCFTPSVSGLLPSHMRTEIDRQLSLSFMFVLSSVSSDPSCSVFVCLLHYDTILMNLFFLNLSTPGCDCECSCYTSIMLAWPFHHGCQRPGVYQHYYPACFLFYWLGHCSDMRALAPNARACRPLLLLLVPFFFCSGCCCHESSPVLQSVLIFSVLPLSFDSFQEQSEKTLIKKEEKNT